MKSNCCGAKETNLIDMKCEDCLETASFTEEFEDGDVITHIPADEFKQWLSEVDTVNILIDNKQNNMKQTEQSKADRIEYLESMIERALLTMEEYFEEGVTTPEHIRDIKGLEGLLDWAHKELQELE